MAMVGTKTGVFLGAEMGRVALIPNHSVGILYHFLSSQGIKYGFSNFASCTPPALPTAHTPSVHGHGRFDAEQAEAAFDAARHQAQLPGAANTFSLLQRSVVGWVPGVFPSARDARPRHARSIIESTVAGLQQKNPAESKMGPCPCYGGLGYAPLDRQAQSLWCCGVAMIMQPISRVVVVVVPKS